MSHIGIDIDGTLAIAARFISPGVIGEPDPKFLLLIKALHQDGHHLYAWSCRADHVISQWLQQHNISTYFDGINKSPATSDSIKASFDFYIGDEALNWNGGNGREILDYIKAHGATVNRCTTDRDTDFMSHQPVPYLAGTGRGYLDMFESHWRNLWVDRKFEKKIALLTICSHAKPYSKSFIHATIRKYLYAANFLNKVDYIHISNAGIIPSGDEMTYPFNAYDHDGSQMSENNRQYFSEILEDRMDFWSNNYASNYDHIVVYLRHGKTWASTQRGLRRRQPVMVTALPTPELGFAAMPDPDDSLTFFENVERLIHALKNLDKVSV